MGEPVRKAVFDDLHCVHCGSLNPADWIKTRKGDKKHYGMQLSEAAVAFLNREHLVKVEKVGEPPKKQVVPGPKRSDASKAVRCCVDWAIKDFMPWPTAGRSPRRTEHAYTRYGNQASNFLDADAAT